MKRKVQCSVATTMRSPDAGTARRVVTTEMLRRLRAFGGALALALIGGLVMWPSLSDAQQTSWRRDYFPNVRLQDHNGRTVRFYDDMLRGKIVAINFVYTDCTTICPLDTAQLRRVQELLGDRVGRDIFFYSISINPTRDTPENLRRFMRSYDLGPGWSFLTGSQADIALLQQRLGITPADLQNLSAHDTSILMGNETTGQWIKRSSFENPQNLANILGERLNNYATRPVAAASARQGYAAASQITDKSQGIYLYRTRCASCHTIGQGDRLGPDLLGVASARPEPWLKRWIREPDKMLAERDPTAMALMARYRNLPMPNLRLSAEEVDAVVDYLRTQDRAAAAARASTARPAQPVRRSAAAPAQRSAGAQK